MLQNLSSATVVIGALRVKIWFILQLEEYIPADNACEGIRQFT